MNHWKEPYPKNINQSLTKAKAIALELKTKLNHKDCPKLQDLFILKKNRRWRDEFQFEQLGYPLNNGNRFKGIYCFGEEINNKIEPVYVGISRNVFDRLKQHTWGTVKSHCTLAYLMHRDAIKKESKRNIDYYLEKGKKKIRPYKVAIYPLENDYDMAFYEIAIAGILRTKWNTFKTH